MDYLTHPKIQARFENAPNFKKSAVTYLRKPRPEEIGRETKTFVKSADGTLRVEASNVVSETCVMARNPGQIGVSETGEAVFNEWLIPRETAEKNYGRAAIESLGVEFQAHTKQAQIKLIRLTPEVMEDLGVSGNTLEFRVSWSPDPMVAQVGDWLSDAGYSVSHHDKETTYSAVESKPNE